MRVQEIMTRSVVTVHARTTIQQAAALMTGHGVTSLPVLDDDDRVIGIVSEADLIRVGCRRTRGAICVVTRKGSVTRPVWWARS